MEQSCPKLQKVWFRSLRPPRERQAHFLCSSRTWSACQRPLQQGSHAALDGPHDRESKRPFMYMQRNHSARVLEGREIVDFLIYDPLKGIC
jgi:hypothetical protein